MNDLLISVQFWDIKGHKLYFAHIASSYLSLQSAWPKKSSRVKNRVKSEDDLKRPLPKGFGTQNCNSPGFVMAHQMDHV